MKITELENMKIITPEEGNMLTNGEVFTDAIFVGLSSQLENWWEVKIEEDSEDKIV